MRDTNGTRDCSGNNSRSWTMAGYENVQTEASSLLGGRGIVALQRREASDSHCKVFLVSCNPCSVDFCQWREVFTDFIMSCLTENWIEDLPYSVWPCNIWDDNGRCKTSSSHGSHSVFISCTQSGYASQFPAERTFVRCSKTHLMTNRPSYEDGN